MTEKEMLEAESKWCENCVNYDKDFPSTDGYAPCKVNGLLTWAQDYNEKCRFRGVPAERIKVKDKEAKL